MKKKRAAFYIRVSTEDQTEYSPEAQLRALKEFANKNNLSVLDKHIFIDEGFSGRKAEKRPAFQKMISTARLSPGAFDVILVHKFDRFARSREDSVVYKSLLRKECGIKVISITEQIEDDKFSIILESMLEAMAEYYSLNLADEVKKGMTEKAKKGGYQSSPPFGYSIENKELKIVPEEASIIKMIFNLYVYENKTFFTIAKIINALNIKTHRGNKFENRTVEYILNNPVYIGKIRWNPHGKTKRKYNDPDIIISPGNHKPIISKDVFSLAQKKLLNKEKILSHKKRPRHEYVHWLSGLIRCSNCGSRLVYSKTKYPSFQCRGYLGGKCNISHSIVISKLKKAVIDKIKIDLGCMEQLSFEIFYNKNKNTEINLLKSQLNKTAYKLNKAKEAFLADVDSLQEYKNNKEHILDEQIQIKDRISELSSASNENNLILQKITNNSLNILISPEASMDQKSLIIQSFVKEIIYNKPHNTLIIEYYIND